MKKLFSLTLALSALLSAMAVSVRATDYTFEAVSATEYYPSSSYEDVYNSRYNYGGSNLTDYQALELPYGVLSTTQTGIMEKRIFNDPVPGAAVGGSVIGSTPGTMLPGSSPGSITTPLPSPIAFTKYSKDFCLSNGAVGRISIPVLGISRYYVWEGETSSSMKKGVAHFSSTSVWDGNVGICGHNRGATYVIGNIKNLEPGDKITYTTSEGTRTYVVETVTAIRNDDWSYLTATSDNRITLITCVKNDSEHRWCVQAVEVN